MRVSLNAAQYSQPYREAPPTYFFHPPLEIGADQTPGQSVLIPASGPPRGGTKVFVNSSLLEAVTRREGRGLSSCRFGGELEGEVVTATAGSSDQIPGAPTRYPGILCEAPPVANTSAVLPLVVEVALSLNRQDFVVAAGDPTPTPNPSSSPEPSPELNPNHKPNPTPSASLPLTGGMSLYTYSPLHTASAVQPPLAPAAGVDGGSSVQVLGSGFGASPTMLCRVGVAEVTSNLAPSLAQPEPQP